MSIDDRRLRLHRKLQDVLGADEARTLMDELGAEGLTAGTLRGELQGVEKRLGSRISSLEDRMDAKVGSLEGRMDAKLGSLEDRMDAKLEILSSRMDARMSALEARLLERMNDQTKSLLRTFMVSNATMVLAVAGLAFGAARLG
jgi:hypothetical protein